MSHADQNNATVVVMEPLLVRDNEAARLLGMSASYFDKHWNSEDFGPRPIRFGRTGKGKLWRVSDLRRWAELGLPSRSEWLEAMNQDKKSGDSPASTDGSGGAGGPRPMGASKEVS